jgi:hypothetical protein
VSFLRSLRSLVLGETLALPISVAALLGAALALRAASEAAWDALGAPFLVVGVLAVLLLNVGRERSTGSG